MILLEELKEEAVLIKQQDDSESNIDSKEYLIRGVPVLGSLKGISEVLSRLSKKNNLPQRLVIVSSNIKSRDVSELMKISEKHGMKLGRAPAPSEVLDGEDSSLIREVSLEDLLGRRQRD